MNLASGLERQSRIFKPTILQQCEGRPATQESKIDSSAPLIYQSMTSNTQILFPWLQLSSDGSRFNISNLKGPRSRLPCPLGCLLATCPDQEHSKAPDKSESDSIMPSLQRNIQPFSKDSVSSSVTEDKCSMKLNSTKKAHGSKIPTLTTSRMESSGAETDSQSQKCIGSKSQNVCSASVADSGPHYDADYERKQLRRKKRYKCPFCTVTCSNMGQLRGHLRCHTGERPFVCDFKECSKKFARNEELTRHKRIHSGVRPYTCESCNKTFGRKDHLQKHEKTHLNPNEKKTYVCPTCKQGYSRSDALARHKATGHSEQGRKT